MTPANLQKLRAMRAEIEAFRFDCRDREYTDTDEAWRIFDDLNETLTDIITEEGKQ